MLFGLCFPANISDIVAKQMWIWICIQNVEMNKNGAVLFAIASLLDDFKTLVLINNLKALSPNIMGVSIMRFNPKIFFLIQNLLHLFMYQPVWLCYTIFMLEEAPCMEDSIGMELYGSQ